MIYIYRQGEKDPRPSTFPLVVDMYSSMLKEQHWEQFIAMLVKGRCVNVKSAVQNHVIVWLAAGKVADPAKDFYHYEKWSRDNQHVIQGDGP